MAEVNWLGDDIRDYIAKTYGFKNCPNCGAPIENEKCPYCGSLFIDFAAMDADKPFFMKIKHNGEIFVVKVKLNNMSMYSEPINLYTDNMMLCSICGPTEIDMNFTVVK